MLREQDVPLCEDENSLSQRCKTMRSCDWVVRDVLDLVCAHLSLVGLDVSNQLEFGHWLDKILTEKEQS
jgi:hypothetical protein